MALNSREQKSLAMHHYVAWLNFPWFGTIYILVMRFVARYKIRNIQAFQAKVQSLTTEIGQRPYIICSNHLTLIDSMIITWAMCPILKATQNFKRVPWHMPEFANFAKNLPLKIMCYLGKSIYVKRGGGSADRRKSMDQVHWLLSENHMFCMFPEGGRSRTGRVQADSVTYSVGELIQQHPRSRVLCIYMRGDAQQSWGKWPALGDTIEADISELNFETPEAGRKGARDVSVKIIDELIRLESEYLDRQNDRLHSPPVAANPHHSQA